MRARRGRGEGSVFRRKDGAWVASLTTGYDHEGKRRRRTIYAGSKTEALERLAGLRHQSLTGALPGPQRQTLAAYLAGWLEDVARPSIRHATYALYKGLIHKHVNPRLGGVPLSRLTPKDMQALLADLERGGASARLRQLVHAVLHRAFRQAVEWGLVLRHPCAAVVRPRAPRRAMQVLTPEQARRFLDAARENRLHALYTVLVGTGLRLGEALGLTWPDVDLGRGTLTVRQQLCEVNGRLWLQEPKTAAARRTLDAPAFVVEALRGHEERMRAEGHLLNDSFLVFVDYEGHPLRKSNLRRRSFLPLLRRAGLPRLRLHDLRHTAATLHLRQGTHPSVVQQMLGHARVSITLDVYSHVLPTLTKEAAARMDTLLQPSGGD